MALIVVETGSDFKPLRRAMSNFRLHGNVRTFDRWLPERITLTDGAEMALQAAKSATPPRLFPNVGPFRANSVYRVRPQLSGETGDAIQRMSLQFRRYDA